MPTQLSEVVYLKGEPYGVQSVEGGWQVTRAARDAGESFVHGDVRTRFYQVTDECDCEWWIFQHHLPGFKPCKHAVAVRMAQAQAKAAEDLKLFASASLKEIITRGRAAIDLLAV